MRIIAGFPGTGKSTFVKSHPFCIDLDSALFPKGEGFVDTYVEAIKQHLQIDGRCVFVSTHPELLEALVKEGLSFLLVYPGVTLKDEYLARYEGRGDQEEFLKQLDDNWFSYLKGLSEIKLGEGCKRVILQRYENLSDVIEMNIDKGFILK